MNGALDILKSRLATSLGKALRSPDFWIEPEAGKRALEKVRADHDSPAVRVNERAIEMAVAAFASSGLVSDFRGLKLICLGAAMQTESGSTLLGDRVTRERLFGLADAGGDQRKQLKCFQNLLRSYWIYPLSSGVPECPPEPWTALREWLSRRHAELDCKSMRKPGWFAQLSKHANLLTEKPCERYGSDLLSGDGSEFQEAVSTLDIPGGSWVLEEAVLSRIRAGCLLRTDREFVSALPDMLKVARGEAGVSISKALAARCAALLVSRYASCPDRPEHSGLRDAAVSMIGNPWLRRASWDAVVVDKQGMPDVAAREMVNGWLKRRLISDFFELLAADGAGDRRRVDYWLRFEPLIDDMWFALGQNARTRHGEGFDDFRHRARGRLLELDQTTADNNAFVMRIGEYLAVEFGAKGNASYLFRWDSLPQALSRSLSSGTEWARVSIHGLKSARNEERLIHRDSEGADKSWEQKFDECICPIIGRRPEDRPRALREHSPARATRPVEPTIGCVERNAQYGYEVPVFVPPRQKSRETELFSWIEFERLAARHGFRFQYSDHRKQGGAIRIIAPNLPQDAADKLAAWGFLRSGDRWWKE